MFYHDKKEWDLGCNFVNQFKLKANDLEALQPYIVDFNFLLFELSKQNVDDLNLITNLSMLLKLLHSFDFGLFEQNIVEIFSSWHILIDEDQGIEDLHKFIQFVYFKGEYSVEEISSKLAQISSELKEEAMTTGERLIQLGIKQGLERGIEQGREEGIEQGLERGIEQSLLKGAQELLIKQLERRFGPLSENECETVHNCKNQDKLESASIAFAENKTKEEVLAELI